MRFFAANPLSRPGASFILRLRTERFSFYGTGF